MRCAKTLPQIGALRELGPLRCVLEEGHEHLCEYIMPRIRASHGQDAKLIACDEVQHLSKSPAEKRPDSC